MTTNKYASAKMTTSRATRSTVDKLPFKAPLPNWLSAGWRPLRVLILVALTCLMPFAVMDKFSLSKITLAFIMFVGAAWLPTRVAASGALPRNTLALIVTAAPILGAYLSSALVSFSVQGLEHVIQLILVVGFVAGMSIMIWTLSSMVALLTVSFFFLMLHLCLWVFEGAPRHFGGPFLHPNALGLTSLVLSFFPLMIWHYRRVNGFARLLTLPTLLMSWLLLFVSSSRASWLAAIVAFCAYCLWPVISGRQWRFWLTLLVVIASALASTYLYLIASSQWWGAQLDQILTDISGRTLFSGRQRFWGELAEAIFQRPMFGHGAGTIASDFTGLPWSAHNLYIQVSLELGLLGLVSLVLFLAGVWSGFWANRHSHTVRLASAFMLGILIHQVFEVTLIQNNLATGFLVWLVIAIGLSCGHHSFARRVQ